MIRNILRKMFGKQYKAMLKKVASRKLLKYGEEGLVKFDRILRENDIEYWLMFGSLLGAVREHGFIKHDDDIDMGMFCKDINEKLVSLLTPAGFEFQRVKITSDKKYRMMTFKYKGVTLDLYGHEFDDDSHSAITGFQTYPLIGTDWRISYKKNLYRTCMNYFIFKGTEDCPFGKTKLKIPIGAHQLLCQLYGEDYMIPLKGKKAFLSPIMEILPSDKLTASMIPLEELDK